MTLPELFKNYLKVQKTSAVTVKNYLADINHFLKWLEQKTGVRHQVAGKAIFGLLTIETIEEYKTDLLQNGAPLSTLNRRLSALRKFGQFGQFHGWLATNPKVTNVSTSLPADATHQALQAGEVLILEKFSLHLEKEKFSRVTIKNYLSDLRHFLTWLEGIN